MKWHWADIKFMFKSSTSNWHFFTDLHISEPTLGLVFCSCVLMWNKILQWCINSTGLDQSIQCCCTRQVKTHCPHSTCIVYRSVLNSVGIELCWFICCLGHCVCRLHEGSFHMNWRQTRRTAPRCLRTRADFGNSFIY